MQIREPKKKVTNCGYQVACLTMIKVELIVVTQGKEWFTSSNYTLFCSNVVSILNKVTEL